MLEAAVFVCMSFLLWLLCHTRRAAYRSRLVSSQMLTWGRMELHAGEIQKEVSRGSGVKIL